MGCACGGGGVVQEMQRMQDSLPRADGTYALASFPGCEGGYRGPLEGQSVYIVARLSDDERLFPSTQLGEAADYMNTLPSRPAIEKLTTVALCAAAVELVYA